MTFRESEATARDPGFSAPSLSSVAIHISFAILSTVPINGAAKKISTEYLRRLYIASVVRVPSAQGVHSLVDTFASLFVSLFNIRRNCPVLLFYTWRRGHNSIREVEGTKTGRLECVSSQCGVAR